MAGMNMAEMNAVLHDTSKVTTKCAGYDFKTCNDRTKVECVGMANTEYVYSLKPKGIVSYLIV